MRLLLWLPLIVVLLGGVLLGGAASAQIVPVVPGSGSGGGEIEAPTTPEGVDRLLAGLTDAEIRALLREELLAEVKARAEAESGPMLTERLAARVSAMITTIAERLERWGVAIANLDQRFPIVEERVANARYGVVGMVAGAAVILIAGLGSALIVSRATRRFRRRIAEPPRPVKYLGRVLRGLALGLTEALSIGAFLVATQFTAELLMRLTAPGLTTGIGSALLTGPVMPLEPWLSGLGSAAAGALAALRPSEDMLGPLQGYVWVYHAGVTSGWGLILASRRVLAPDAPAIALTQLPQAAAAKLQGTVRLVVSIGVGAWLIAGLMPNLGLGFPPAILTVAFGGTLAAFILIYRTVRGRNAIRDHIQQLIQPEAPAPSLFARAAPVVLVLYLLGAGAYWIGHWLERGQHELYGPAGTLLILLLMPALDKAGAEIAAALTGRTERGRRYSRVLQGSWRMLLILGAVVLVLELWELPIWALAFGAEADPFVAGAVKVAIALAAARLAWQLIDATFHVEPRAIDHDSEEGPGDDAAQATRLQTLVPLLRTLLLIFVGTVAVMGVLASIGLDIGPLLASAGIIGIAIGFGAQTLVRDIFSGAFFLIDDAFRLGEYIEIDQDIRGEVEAISIRSLRLRHHRGPILTIPFGELKSIKNHNRDWVIYKMEFRMEPETDPQAVKKIVKQVGKDLWAHPEHGPKFLEPLKSQGVLMIDEDSALVIRVKFKCKPRTQFVLRREVYHALRRAFFENGIGLARRKVEVVSSGAGGDELPPGAAAAAEALPQAAAARPDL